MKAWIAVASLIAWTGVNLAQDSGPATSTFSSHRALANPAGQPPIAIAREGLQVKITFTGTLQSAQTIDGQWTEVPDAASPYTEDPAGKGKFYRAVGPESISIFASRSVVDMAITGPFQTYFDKAFAGTPDGIFPPHREKPYFEATLQVNGQEIPVSMRVRGNSSLQECPFPKMKLKVSKDERPGTPFEDAREIRIGTHCAEGGQGNIGRLRDQTAAFREALAYETMEMLGFIAPRGRRARIEYRDITPTNGGVMGGWQLIRHAVLLDDIEVVGERLGGRALDDQEVEDLTKANFDQQLVTDLQFLHALLGNWDYALSSDGAGLRNTDVLELANGKLVPVAGDFDLASFVTGEVRSSAPHEFHPELGDVERQARFEIEQIQQRVSAPSFSTARDRYLAQRPALEAQINAAEIDEAGRTNALRHMTAFYDALAAVPSP